MTPNIAYKKRGEEIHSYLKQQNCDNYVILDDYHEESFKDWNLSNFVKTKMKSGLTSENAL